MTITDEQAKNARVPTEIFCPLCKTQHVDQDEWAHEIAHRKHLCASCGHVWAPYDVGTIGVDFHVACHKRRDELLQLVANLSQSVPLESEVSEALSQRGVLLAEVGTLKGTIKTLRAAVEELQLGLRKACEHATTHLPEDREVINEMTRLSHKDYFA